MLLWNSSHVVKAREMFLFTPTSVFAIKHSWAGIEPNANFVKVYTQNK